MSFVADASITASWILPDERHELALRCYRMLETTAIVVPVLWRFEVWNLLVAAERRKRVVPSFTDNALLLLEEYTIIEDGETAPEKAVALARTFSLTVYDATYLEVAQRLRLPLATLDRRLEAAARSADVELM